MWNVIGHSVIIIINVVLAVVGFSLCRAPLPGRSQIRGPGELEAIVVFLDGVEDRDDLPERPWELRVEDEAVELPPFFHLAVEPSRRRVNKRGFVQPEHGRHGESGDEHLEQNAVVVVVVLEEDHCAAVSLAVLRLLATHTLRKDKNTYHN